MNRVAQLVNVREVGGKVCSLVVELAHLASVLDSYCEATVAIAAIIWKRTLVAFSLNGMTGNRQALTRRACRSSALAAVSTFISTEARPGMILSFLRSFS